MKEEDVRGIPGTKVQKVQGFWGMWLPDGGSSCGCRGWDGSVKISFSQLILEISLASVLDNTYVSAQLLSASELFA